MPVKRKPSPASQTLTGQLLISDTPGRMSLQPGTLHVVDGVIEEIQLGEIDANASLGDDRTLICPGLIDTHVHLPQFDVIGAHGMPLLRWLDEVIFPAEILWNDTDFAKRMTQRVIGQCLSVGTTGVAAYATSCHGSTMDALHAFHETGMHALVGQVLMDRGGPAALCHDPTQLIEETQQTLDAFPPGSRVQAAVTPRFALACSAELMASAGKLAAEASAYVQTHLAETRAECERVSELFPDRRYTEVYADAGLLSERSLLGHGIFMDEQDHRLLASSGAIVAHCPTANSFLQSGVMNRAQLMQSGVRMTLGSDVGAGYQRSMIRVAQGMIEAASQITMRRAEGIHGGQQVSGVSPEPAAETPSAPEAWYQITTGNADALGWSDVGRIAVGATADLLVIRPELDWLAGPVDPLSRLLFSWDDRWLRATLLNGAVRWSDREFVDHEFADRSYSKPQRDR
ncbi:amidohydrolase family protein [Stieleria varia]|uniref:Guanine deaminase n=1 Tax=Stieleria varia TaxID=2528005 RepID=A0A5C6B5S3_9BACT|nr:amidohydrolase family protein [Stieleria varia]TWU07635.1 Guanine deaminase [Stieleria varia]